MCHVSHIGSLASRPLKLKSRKPRIPFSLPAGEDPRFLSESFVRPRPVERTAGVRAEQVPVHRSLNDAEIRTALEALPELTLAQEQCLFRLCCLSLQYGYAWISQESLAPLLRCSTRSLRDDIALLRARSLLKTERTARGLRYFPVWHTLGLEAPTPRAAARERPPEVAAARDRNPVPMHCRSTSGSDEKVKAEQVGSVQQADNAPVGFAAAALPLVAVPTDLERALRDKLGVPAYRALARVLRNEQARRSPELSIEALRRLLTRREVRNAAGLFVTMLRDDLIARDEALAVGELDEPAPVACAKQARMVEVRRLNGEVQQAVVRGDLDRADTLRDQVARLLGAPTRQEQRAASTRVNRWSPLGPRTEPDERMGRPVPITV